MWRFSSARRGDGETDAAKRNELFHDIQLYEQENGPFVPLFQPGVHFAFSDLQGFATTASGALT